MRILIDKCADPRVKQLFRGHEVATVRDQGWGAMVPKSQIAYYRAIRMELLEALTNVRR
jgi:hypothetical protein